MKKSFVNNTNLSPSMLARKEGGKIAYEFISGKSPGIIFLPGLKSDMNGEKATAIRSFCAQKGYSFLRFDYRGHGSSSGSFEEHTIGDWLEDCLFVLDNLTRGPQVLVGSSMGGWLMLLVTLLRPNRITALLGLAVAPDFTEHLIWKKLNLEQKKQIEREGFIDLPNCYDPLQPFRITYNLIKEARNHLILSKNIPIDIPVVLFHGLNDKDVPFSFSNQLLEKLESDEVDVTIIKSGDHRLSREVDIQRIIQTLAFLVKQAKS